MVIITVYNYCSNFEDVCAFYVIIILWIFSTESVRLRVLGGEEVHERVHVVEDSDTQSWPRQVATGDIQ